MQIGILFFIFMVAHIIIDVVLFFCGINVIEKIGFCYRNIEDRKSAIVVKNSKIYSYLFCLVACAILLHPSKTFIAQTFPDIAKILICAILYAIFGTIIFHVLVLSGIIFTYKGHFARHKVLLLSCIG